MLLGVGGLKEPSPGKGCLCQEYVGLVSADRTLRQRRKI